MKNDEAIKVFEDYLTTGHVPHPYELREASKAAITVLSSYEQMMKEAVEGEVYQYYSYNRDAIAILVDIPKENIGYKVRIIIIKEEG